MSKLLNEYRETLSILDKQIQELMCELESLEDKRHYVEILMLDRQIQELEEDIKLCRSNQKQSLAYELEDMKEKREKMENL